MPGGTRVTGYSEPTESKDTMSLLEEGRAGVTGSARPTQTPTTSEGASPSCVRRESVHRIDVFGHSWVPRETPRAGSALLARDVATAIEASDLLGQGVATC